MHLNMPIDYDKSSDSAYIYLQKLDSNGVAETYTCDELPDQINGDINLDFDKNGRLCGIEILNASKILPAYILSGKTE